LEIPLADAAAVYMTAPLFVTLLSVPLLGEKVGVHRWAAVIVGFSAAVVMLNPGSGVFQFTAAIPLFSALCYAMIPIINRKIGLSEHALTMAIYTVATYLFLILLLSLVLKLLPDPGFQGKSASNLFRQWVIFSTRDWGLVGLTGCLFSVALLCITQAYRIATVSTVAPFEYSYLLWASVIGFAVFGNVPGLRTVLGGLIVVACGCYIVYREKRTALTGEQ
jgi:S-adenosylmethionine uptake transporter